MDNIKKLDRRGNKTIAILFILFILIVNVFNILTRDRDKSEFENRFLSQRPKLSIDTLLSGSFTEKYEKYITDQFVWRDSWVAMKSDIERIMLKGENKGIYFGKEGYLLEHYKKPKEELDKNVESINHYMDRLQGMKTYFILVPNSVEVYEEMLPKFASPYEQVKVINHVSEEADERINFLDVYDSLMEHKDEYIYFRTDHHWTARGAYYAYVQLAQEMGFKPYSIEDFESEVITEDFYGTYYSKAGNRGIEPDSIEIFRPRESTDYEIYFLDEDRYMNGLYEYKHLDTRDKYSIFIDGNHSLMRIKSGVDNNKKIIVFKDSYAHAFIPFLVNHYEEVHVVDLRYYRKNIYDYIEKNGIDETLFLYNVSSFSDLELMKPLWSN